MFSIGTECHHQGRECVIVDTNFLGVRIQYLDDESFFFVKASQYSELMIIEKTPGIKQAEDKRLPAHPFRQSTRVYGPDGMSQASKEMHRRKKGKE